MPVEPFELIKLIIGLLVIIIPGYLWSFLFFKQLTRFERIVFGFVFGLGFLACAAFIGNVVFNITITQTFIVLLFALYAAPAFILYGLNIYKTGLPKIDLTSIKNKKFLLLVSILVFTFFMVFLPHLSNNHFLPFYVDEWIHWSYSRAVMESGSTTFLNPYIGLENVADLEIGFHLVTACIKWLSGCNFLTLFLFMPSIIGVFISLTAFNIGERSERKFGLESAFFIGFIPTTIRFLGPSFYAPVTLGLLLLIFVIWLGQLKKLQGALFTAMLICFMFIVHPPTAFAGIVILLIFSVFLALEKKYKIALLISLVSTIPIIIVYFLTLRWDAPIELFLQTLSGKKLLLGLPYIEIDFGHLGIPIWVLFLVGMYYSFNSGSSLKRAMSFSCIIFIITIALYSIFGYGFPILYERMFLYLFLMVALMAGVGLSELRKYIVSLAEKKPLKKYKRLSNNARFLLPMTVCILLFATAVPSHLGIPYYQMIDEEDYEAFDWIRNNIESYRNEIHLYDGAAVHPFKASPFSAITGLYIASSSMHPTYGLSLSTQMEKFLNEKCVDISFLEQHRLSVAYGDCDNESWTEVYENILFYNGFPPQVNFTYLSGKPTLNDTVFFASNFTTPFSKIMLEWDFGDGAVSYGETIGLNFDGIDDYVVIADDPSLDITDAITVEMWVKPMKKSQKMIMIGKEGVYHFWCSDNAWYFGVYDESKYHGSGYSSTVIPTGKWSHVLGIYDASLPTDQVQIWINGVKENSRNFSGGIKNLDSSFLIGGKLSPWEDGYFNGSITNIKIYNRRLTLDEISRNYNATSDDDVLTNGLIHWWKMDEMDKVAQDSVGSNDGIIYGAKWINTVSHRYSYPGTYRVNLTVWNEEGLNHLVSKNITIS